MKRELALVALGGNALSKSGSDSFSKQLIQAKAIARSIASAARDRDLVITHGNGPQVGNQLMRNELSKSQVPPLPLDACGADTQGEIGYMLQQAISNEMKRAGMEGRVATIITQVLVDPQDPAFQNPSKPIGPFLPKGEADELKRRGYAVAPDPRGRGFRRIVPSPKPIRILELETIRELVEGGVTTITCGGGGIPVVDSGGFYVGIDAVIDTDLCSGLLAKGLRASSFVILTDIERVCIDFGKPTQQEIAHMSASEARRYLAEGQFPDGSMGPKVEAAVDFLRSSGKRSCIGSADRLLEILEGKAGTEIHI